MPRQLVYDLTNAGTMFGCPGSLGWMSVLKKISAVRFITFTIKDPKEIEYYGIIEISDHSFLCISRPTSSNLKQTFTDGRVTDRI